MRFRTLLISCLLLANCGRTDTPNVEANTEAFENSVSVPSAKDVERLKSLPVFDSNVGSLSNPTIVDVDMCSQDRTRCLWDDWKEFCQLTGDAEIIFNFHDNRGYLRLSHDNATINVILRETLADDASVKNFESADGRLRVNLEISDSNSPRGRAEGPGLVGMMMVEHDGEAVPYAYPFPRTQIHGSINCNSVN